MEKKEMYRWFTKFFFPERSAAVFFIFFITCLYALGAWFIFTTNGTHTSYVHILYIPVVLMAMSYGLWGGVIGGVISFIVSGPWMPLSVNPPMAQTMDAYLFRGLFFIFIGVLIGFGASLFKRFSLMQKQRLSTDLITGLMNLRGLKNIVDTWQDTEVFSSFFVVLIEMPQLSSIEKAIGSSNTQKLLKMVGHHFSSMVSQRAYLGFLETGSFVVVSLDQPTWMNIDATLMGSTFNVKDIPIFMEFYFGIASSTQEDQSLVSVIRKAKVAASRAIAHRQKSSYYTLEDDYKDKRTVDITHDLNMAILNRQLHMVYQPKYCLKTMALKGVEALVRWPHPYLGMISPAEFIPIIESTLLINPFTKWMLQEVLSQMALWKQEDCDISVAVNFSMANFHDPSILEYLLYLFKHHGISAHQLEVEVTETAVAQNIQVVAERLHILRNLGVSIAIDDFGMGQSSMQYLRTLPVDVLKIDCFFTKDMEINASSEAITRSAILLAHELHLKVVAEGIENQYQYARLKAMGCDLGQGFFLSKPLDPDALLKQIKGL